MKGETSPWKIQVAKPSLTQKEADAVSKCILDGRITAGPKVKEFERKLCEYSERGHVIMTSSGSAALDTAVIALGLEAGTRVAVPALTYQATEAAVWHAGLNPEYVDVNGQGIMDLDTIPKDVGLILAVDLYGWPIGVAAKKIQQPVVIDAAESLGSTFYGVPTVDRGEIAITSFYGNKIITTGEGGAIFTDDGDLADECRLIINHYMRQPYDHYSPFGYNYAPNEMAAVVGLEQLARLPSFLGTRAMLSERYFQRLGHLMLHRQVPDEVKLNRWAMPVVFGSEMEKGRVSLHLHACGIETRPIFTPLNVMAHFAGDCPQAEDIWRRGLLLPMHTSLTLGDVDYICEEVERGLRP